MEEEKRRKRNQGVLVEEHGESLDVDNAKNLIPVTLQSLLNSSHWVKKDGLNTSETLQMKILKGKKKLKKALTALKRLTMHIYNSTNTRLSISH